jgi:hypothetical protein
VHSTMLTTKGTIVHRRHRPNRRNLSVSQPYLQRILPSDVENRSRRAG